MTEQKGALTSTDRKFLRGEKEYESKQGRYDRRESIRERTRGALHDFQLLAQELDSEEREKIFSDDLSEEIAGTIEFLYAGMGGELSFRPPLELGVASGEVALGNIDHSLHVDPRFEVNTHRQENLDTVVDTVENYQWHQITRPPAAIGFIKLAMRASAIDFESIREQLEYERSGQTMAEQVLDQYESADE